MLPWFQHLSCILVEVGLDADTAGSGCDVLPDLPTLNLRHLRRLFKVPDNNFSMIMISDLRKSIFALKQQGTLKEITSSRLNRMNFNVARIYVNGQLQKIVWSMSGWDEGASEVQTLMQKNLLLEVATEVGEYGNAGYRHGEARILRYVDDFVTENMGKTIFQGDTIGLEIVTERKPCPVCGGESGLAGGFRKLGKRFEDLELYSIIDVGYAKDTNAPVWQAPAER